MKRIALAIALSLAAFGAQAAEVRPLTTVFAPGTKTGVLTVRSTEKVVKTYQVSVDRWSVVNGQKVRTASTELRMAPSIFTLEPGTTQTLRWVLKPDGSPEQAFRILLEELPDPARVQQAGLTQVVNIDFPWFWRAQDLSPVLSASWEGPVLVLKNSGAATAQLVDLVAGSVNRPGLVGYVLPGETARFELDGTGVVPVSVKVNGKDTVLAVQ